MQSLLSWSLCSLTVPEAARGLVLLAESGCRIGGKGQADAVAAVLQAHRFAVLRVELLQRAEAAEPEWASDLALLAGRWAQAISWTAAQASLARLPLGLFGEDADAAAALYLLAGGAERQALHCASPTLPAPAGRADGGPGLPTLPSGSGGGSGRWRVAAVVCGGGRLDLLAPLGREVAEIDSPTLLLVGAEDPAALRHNRHALLLLSGKKRLEAVPGAGRGFDRHGARGVVSELAGAWFEAHLAV